MTHMALSGPYQVGARVAGRAGLSHAPSLSHGPCLSQAWENVTLSHGSYIKAVGIPLPAVWSYGNDCLSGP